MSAADINLARFTGMDADSILDDLIGLLQARFGGVFNNFVTTELGIMLLEVVTQALSHIGFYVDRRASDNLMETSRTDRAVARAARQLGYAIGGATAATIDLHVSIADPVAFSVPIIPTFAFKGPRGLIYEIGQPVTFAPNAGPSDTLIVPCFEGRTTAETFVSDGTPNQIFTLRRTPTGKFILQGSVVVTVNGTPWEENDLLRYGQNNAFEVNYLESPGKVRFGNGVFGNVPTAGANIAISYVVTSGANGRVTKGEVTQELNPLIVNNQQISLIINNPEDSKAGDGPESKDRVRSLAGRVFKARELAITEGDYEALATRFSSPIYGRVALARAYVTRTAVTDLKLQELSNTIQQAVGVIDPTVTASVTSAQAHATAIAAYLTTITSILSAIADLTTDADAELLTALTSARSSKNLSIEMQTVILNGKAAVDSSSASAPEKTTIKGFFDALNTAATTLSAASDTEAASIASARDSLAAIGLTTGDGQLALLETARAGIETEVGEDPDTGIFLNLETINDTVVDNTAIVNTNLDAIAAHLERYLSADCKSNLITVAILGLDADGFYVAPSFGLTDALQTYFSGVRKSPVDVVSVVSGANSLLPAVITVEIGVLSDFSQTSVEATARTILDAVLKQRPAKKALRLSDLYTPIRAVAGVDYVNVKILGHLVNGSTVASRLDAAGNLIPRTEEVITKGTVTITTVTA